MTCVKENEEAEGDHHEEEEVQHEGEDNHSIKLLLNVSNVTS